MSLQKNGIKLIEESKLYSDYKSKIVRYKHKLFKLQAFKNAQKRICAKIFIFTGTNLVELINESDLPYFSYDYYIKPEHVEKIRKNDLLYETPAQKEEEDSKRMITERINQCEELLIKMF